MKKVIIGIVFGMAFLSAALVFAPHTYAQENTPSTETEIGAELTDALSPEALETLNKLGITSPNASEISKLNITDIFSAVSRAIAERAGAPSRAFASIVGILLIFAVLDTIRDGLTTDAMQEVMKVVTVLSVTFILILPVTELIQSAVSAISASSKFMLAYVPVITGVLIASGNMLTSGSYYAIMIFACHGISQLCASVISPLLNIFFGLSITGAVCPVFRLEGICKALNRLIKWALGFSMSLFSAALTFKTMITAVADSISTRAVRFSLSSFVPIVGSALSEAYKTVQSSVRLLKSGIGIFSIIAVVIVFMPVIIQGLLWMLSISLSKGAAEILAQDAACTVLEVSGDVISTTLVIILCILAVFVISTTVLLMSGGML